jgi:hypothetical protein
MNQNSEKKIPLTRPSLQMFAPYGQTIRGVVLVCTCIGSLIAFLYILLHI